MKNSIWVEKYRPKTINEYVFKDDRLRKKVESWIKEKDIPHVLFCGPAGTGKTSLIHILINELEINEGDVLEINASEATSVDIVREQILNFSQTVAWGSFKIVVLEEFEMMSPSAQSALKRILEDYAEHVRFMFTSNNPQKIIAPLRSRMQEVVIDKLDKESFTLRTATILQEENIEITEESLDILDQYIRISYPDLRKCITLLQQNCQDGQLLSPTEDASGSQEYLIKAIELIKENKTTEARELICAQIRLDEFEDFYRFLYRNLDLWGDTAKEWDEALLVIKRGLVDHAFIADAEINLASTLVSLGMIKDNR